MRDPRRLSQDPNAGALARALREAAELGSRERVSSAWQRIQPALDRVPAEPIGTSTSSGLSALTKGAWIAGTLALGAVGWLVLAPADAGLEPTLASSPPPAPPVLTPSRPAAYSAPSPAVQLEPQPSAQTQPVLPAPSVSSRPSARTIRAQRATPLVIPATSPIAVAPAPPDPEGELVLLTRAQEKLEVAPAAALALLAEHEQRYPSGVLVQERELMRIDAERALGRSDSAVARARAFLTHYPRSPQRTRLQAWLSTRSQSDVPAAEADKP